MFALLSSLSGSLSLSEIKQPQRRDQRRSLRAALEFFWVKRPLAGVVITAAAEEEVRIGMGGHLKQARGL